MGQLETFPNSKNMQPPSTQGFCLKCRGPASKGKVETTITINGAAVSPGAIIAFDGSGVVCIPQKMLEDLIEKAKTITEKEEGIRKQLLEGKLLGAILNF